MIDSVEKMLDDVESYGLDTLVYRDNYSEVPDKKFQYLYFAYITAHKQLTDYIEELNIELEE